MLDQFEFDESQPEFILRGFRPADEEYYLDRIVLSDLNGGYMAEEEIVRSGQFVLEFDLPLSAWVVYPIKRKEQ